MNQRQTAIDKYTALVMQPHVVVAERPRRHQAEPRARVCNMIDFGVGYCWELPARLVVFPEYFLQGVTTPGKGEHGIDSFMKKAITFDGPEDEPASVEKAREYDMYIAGGGVIEQVPQFPDRWFNTAFIIGPDGEVVLRTTSGTSRRRSASAPARTTCSTNTAKSSAATSRTCFR